LVDLRFTANSTGEVRFQTDGNTYFS
jgi:hypothetical protein